MNLKKLEIINQIHLCKNSLELLAVWDENENFFKENDGYIIFSEIDNATSKLPRLDIFSNDKENFKSLFHNNNFIFLNNQIFEDITQNRESKIPIDYTVSFDTQFASFIQRYFINKEFSQKKDVESVLYKLIDNDINVDYLPYLLENTAKEVDFSGVKDTMKEVIKFFHLDKSSSIMLMDMKVKNIENYQKECNDRILHMQNNQHHELFKDFKMKHQIMYIILMKIIIVDKEETSVKQKLDKFVSFMDNEIYTIFDRELTVAQNFFEDKNKLSFFHGVNNINKKTLSKLKNMAWDFALVRHLESSFSARPLNVDFFLSYFITFDKGLSQIIDLYPLKAIVFFKKLDALHIIPKYSKEQLMIDYKLERYFTKEALSKRLNKQKNSSLSDFTYLVKELENKINEFIV